MPIPMESPSDEEDMEIDVAFEDTDLDAGLDYTINISPRHHNTQQQQRQNIEKEREGIYDDEEEGKPKAILKDKKGIGNIDSNTNQDIDLTSSLNTALSMKNNNSTQIHNRRLSGGRVGLDLHSGSGESGTNAQDCSLLGNDINGDGLSNNSSSGTGEIQPLRKINGWIVCSRVMLWIICLGVISLGCVVIWQLVKYHAQRHIVAWCIAAIFVGVAVPLSFHDMHMHMLHYRQPELQKYYIRILWMVPIYSIESWCALRFKEQAVLLETMREAYEAYVVYSFYMLLIKFLGGEEKVVTILERRALQGHEKNVPHMLPFCCLPKWELGDSFVTHCTVGVFQYVFIRTFLAMVQLLSSWINSKNKESDDTDLNKWDYTNYTIEFVLNCAQIWALYCLVLFYHELANELAPIKPLGKFISVKLVVFFSFWQNALIEGFVYEGYIKDLNDYSKEEISSGLQNFLICIEMAIAAISHRWVFSYHDFDHLAKLKPAIPVRRAVFDMLPTDVVMDTREKFKDIRLLPSFSGKKSPGKKSPKTGKSDNKSNQNKDDKNGGNEYETEITENKSHFNMKFSPVTNSSSSSSSDMSSLKNSRLKKTNGGRRTSKESLILQMDQDDDKDNIGNNVL